jgi:hypothetical protein
MFKDLFREFNERCDAQNEGLNHIHRAAPDAPLTDQERDQLYNYFNLCGEEHLYAMQGFIEPEVWNSWKAVMRFYRQNPRAHCWQEQFRRKCARKGIADSKSLTLHFRHIQPSLRIFRRQLPRRLDQAGPAWPLSVMESAKGRLLTRTSSRGLKRIDTAAVVFDKAH